MAQKSDSSRGSISSKRIVALASRAERPLTAVPVGEVCRIKRVDGPARRRLGEMGLVAGRRLSVVQRAVNDMLIVGLGPCRLAMARGLGDSILVE